VAIASPPRSLGSTVFFGGGGTPPAPPAAGPVTSNLSVVNVRIAPNAVPNDGTPAAALINAIIAGIAAANATIYFPPGVYGLEANVTFPTNIQVWLEQGAFFKATAPGVSLTINGELTASNAAQIFDTSVQPLAVNLGTGTPSSPQNIYAQWWGAVADGVKDSTSALQAAIDVSCHSNAQLGRGTALFLPAGNYKITAPLRLKNVMLHMVGAGKYETIIHYEGVAGGCLVSDAIVYNNLRFEHFGIIGDAGSGKGIDLSATTSQTYNCVFREMYIIAGQQAMHIPNCFSTIFDSVSAGSINNHAFQVLCGPAVGFINCYAIQAGAGKAGYRLTGSIRLYSCNGINTGDYWGIFGCDTAAVDGFQNDFVLSYPDVVLYGCNVEAWAVSGILLHSIFIKFEMQGGDFSRALAGTYHSLLHARGSNGDNGYVLLDHVRAFITGGASTASPFYSDVADFLYVKGPMSLLGGITGMYSVTFGAIRPAINEIAYPDDYQQTAIRFSALHSDRVTAASSLNLGGAGGVGGLNGAPAVSSGKLIKRVIGIPDNTPTAILAATILNVAQSELLRITLLASLGAGGAIGANETSGSVSYDFDIARRPGISTGASSSAPITPVSAAVAGGAAITVTAAGVITGAVGNAQTLTINVTIARGSGASTNHTCVVVAEIINANAQGVTIS
jgi:hypothetical protein